MTFCDVYLSPIDGDRDLSPTKGAGSRQGKESVVSCELYAVATISTGITARAMAPFTFSTISIFPSMRQ